MNCRRFNVAKSLPEADILWPYTMKPPNLVILATVRTFRQRKILTAGVIALGLALQVRLALLNQTGWGVDFNQFYSAGRLTGTGYLYDWDSLRKIEARHGLEVPTGRLPVVLYGHKILGLFPYRAAQFIWMALSLAALIVFALVWPGARGTPMLFALAWSTPATFAILFGQDIPFWLMFLATNLSLMERKRPWSAGIALSLCICKFHLALGIPVMLAAQKRWKTLIAAASSTSVLIVFCFLIEGPQWPLRYAKMSQMAAFSPPPEVMPTISGLAARLPWTLATEVVAGLALLLLCWVVCRDTTRPGMAGATAAACGLLVAPHALFADTALLIPMAVLTIRQTAPFWLKAWAGLILSPAPFLVAAIWQKPWIWQILIPPFVVTAALVARPKQHSYIPRDRIAG